MGDNREKVNIRYKVGEARAARVKRAASAGGLSPSGTAREENHPRAAKAKVEMGANGIQVEGDDGAKVSLGKEGINVKGRDAEVRIDESGLRIRSAREGGDSKEEADKEDEAVLYEEDGLRVSHRKEKKDKAFPIVWLLYNTLFLGLWSATPGKRILRLKVILMEGGKLDWKLAFVRSLFTLVSGVCLFLGYLWALWERDRRGWHDLLAGTRVSAAE